MSGRNQQQQPRLVPILLPATTAVRGGQHIDVGLRLAYAAGYCKRTEEEPGRSNSY